MHSILFQELKLTAIVTKGVHCFHAVFIVFPYNQVILTSVVKTRTWDLKEKSEKLLKIPERLLKHFSGAV